MAYQKMQKRQHAAHVNVYNIGADGVIAVERWAFASASNGPRHEGRVLPRRMGRRRGQGPRAKCWTRPDVGPVRYVFDALTLRAPSRQDDPSLAESPVSMFIDEVEALWDPVDVDGWRAFHARVRALGERLGADDDPNGPHRTASPWTTA